LKTSSNKINRRQAIGFAAACCGGIGGDPVNAAQRIEPPSNLRRRIRSLHLELLLFNHELVPQFLADREEPSASEAKRARRFLAVSLYMRRLLDQQGAGAEVIIDEAKLCCQLQRLHVSPALTFPLRTHESAVRICIAMKKPVGPYGAVETVRNAGDEELKIALESTAATDYLVLVESLFLIRPDTPVSLLAIHSQENLETATFRNVRTTICGNLMKRLAHDHFHQTLAIGHLPQSNCSRHPSTLSDVFGVLIQKWQRIMRDNFKPAHS
jgi:hypothetical protein